MVDSGERIPFGENFYLCQHGDLLLPPPGFSIDEPKTRATISHIVLRVIRECQKARIDPNPNHPPELDTLKRICTGQNNFFSELNDNCLKASKIPKRDLLKTRDAIETWTENNWNESWLILVYLFQVLKAGFLLDGRPNRQIPEKSYPLLYTSWRANLSGGFDEKTTGLEDVLPGGFTNQVHSAPGKSRTQIYWRQREQVKSPEK